MRERMVRTLVLVGILGLSGCEEQGPAERAGELIDDAISDVEDAVRDAREDAEDLARDTRDEAEDAAAEIADALRRN